MSQQATSHDKKPIKPERRRFLQSSAGLLIGVYLPVFANQKSGAAAVMQTPSEAGATLSPNAFVRIAEDNTVTILSKHIEFGQGPFTGLATLAAEEMGADWSQMRAAHAPANVEHYKNLAFGVQGTGGSTAIANSYHQMRRAGATARAMLVSAAATRWKVPDTEITVNNGIISHKNSGKQASFGELAASAAELPAPNNEPALKKPSEFKLIGTDLPKLDTTEKTLGQAQFTLDIYQENMLTAVVAHPPAFGGIVNSFDDSAARKIPGVVDIKKIPQGIVVYAKNTYAAIKGRDALKINWDTSQAETRSSKTLFKLHRDAAQKPGANATSNGDTDKALQDAAKTLELEYSFPYLAHAPMETLDAVILAHNDSDKIEAWLGSQLQTVDQGAIAQVFNTKPENVIIHTQLAGGSFGRRAQPDSGFAVEAALATKAVSRGTPVKLIWTREDDIKGGRYRPMVFHKLRGGIDNKGNIIGWQQTIVTQSIVAGSPFEGMIQNGIDPTSVEGASDLPYTIPNLDVSLHSMQTKVPVLWWRSVGHTHTAYTVETFIDMLLELADKNPVEGRLELLKKHPRESHVLRTAARMAKNAGPTPQDRARGIAVHKSFGSFVAQIAEISNENGFPKVHRVWCAVDCGIAVNPNVIKAQMEGGIGYGLGAILFDEITLGENGTVIQSNFDTYRSLRINEMPDIEVEIIKSDIDPTGVGEPGTPPIGPAVANAWRRLTGQKITHLPFISSVQQMETA